MQTFLYHISGLNCQACEGLAEQELRVAPGVEAVKASLARHTVEVTGDFGEKPLEVMLRELGPLVQKHGFTMSLEQTVPAVKWSEFRWAVPIALALALAFILAQKVGLGKLIGSSEMGYGMAFLIGVIASLSSCMAIVGGLVLSMSAYYAQKGERTRPQWLFHASRLVSFFILGGLIGVVGSAFQFGAFGAMILGVAVGVVMIIMGIGLLNIYPWAKRFQVMLPRSVGERIQVLSGRRARFLPLALGAATFFLPCGFTQSMQLYSLTTGNFSAGALTMFSFALGTFPVLALLSFSTFGTRGREKSGIFFKTAGLIVVFFGLYDILNNLVGYGLIPPIY